MRQPATDVSSRYILMPPAGFRAAMMTAPQLRAVNQVQTLALRPGVRSLSGSRAPKPRMRVLASLHEDGPKLVEMSDEAALALRLENPGMRVLPIFYYKPAMAPRPAVAVRYKPKAAAAATFQVSVVDRASRSPVAGAHVYAFTDYAAGVGVEGTTNARGFARLRLSGRSIALDRLYVFGPAGYWGYFARNTRINSDQMVAIRRIDLGTPDLVRMRYASASSDAGSDVRVAVLDTGVAKTHTHLAVNAGLSANCVYGENRTDWGPANIDGGEHGTHVAGIIAARGVQPDGLSGIAPGVDLVSYRVFGNGQSEGASTFDIIAAIDEAAEAGCDLVNMSLGGPRDPRTDEAFRTAIRDAAARGTLSIVAAGNDGRQPVSFPAGWSECVAVSAMGRKGSFPAESTETADVVAPYGKPDKMAFIAAFSNIGEEIDVTGPGVGVISTVPMSGYAAMSGTSMACPAVAGVAARLLSADATVRGMARDADRTAAIRKLLLGSATSQGFGRDYEGFGLP